MNRLLLNFDKREVVIDRPGQHGKIIEPELVQYRNAVSAAAGLPYKPWKTLEFNFDAQSVRADGVLMRLVDKVNIDTKIYESFNYGPIDLSSLASIVEAFVNGVIDEDDAANQTNRGNE